MYLGRRILAPLLGSLMMIGIAHSAEATPAQLRVGTSLTQMPWGFHDANQKPVGVDVSLCGAIAKQLGDKSEFIDLDFKGLIPALQAKRFDMVCAAMYITPEREKAITMVPYIKATQTIVAKQSTKINGIDDLCGHSVSVLQGSGSKKILEDASKRCMTAGKSAVAVQAFDTQPVAIRALENDSVQAFIATDALISYFMKQNPGLKKVATGISPLTLGIGVAQDNKELAGKVHKALQAMKANGTYDRLLNEWGIQDAAIDLQ